MTEEHSPNQNPSISIWAGIFLIGALSIYLYLPVFDFFLYRVSKGKDFDYIYLAPLILGYLIWDKRKEIKEAYKNPSLAGLGLFLLGTVLFWLGELSGEYYSQYVSFLLLIAGAIWSIWGLEVIRRLFFVFLTALFFLPFPVFIIRVTTAKLQLVSSALGVEILRLLGRSVYREGNVIDIGFHKLQVVEACSGLRYVLSLLILALLMGYLSRLRPWQRSLLFAAAIPVAVLANALRIAATAILMEQFGQEVAEGFFHDFEGFFIFGFAFIALYAVAALLKRFSKSTAHISPADQQRQTKRTGYHKAKAYAAISSMLVLVGTSCWAYTFVNFREAVPAIRPLDEFPLKIGNWQGQRLTLEQRFLDSLDLTDYILIDYQDGQGRPINFYVAYYATQRKGESIHSPATCLRGAGWIFRRAGTKDVRIPGTGVIRVRSALLEKGSQRQLVYYWFQKGERVIDNVWALKWYVFWDALTRQRTDGALVRIITPVIPNEAPEEADERIRRFMKEAVPILYEFLPAR